MAKTRLIMQEWDKASSTDRGYDSRWRRARARYLSLHPLCKKCRDRDRKSIAKVVDHIVPHKLFDAINSGDPARIAEARKLFWDQKNWQGLCTVCHDSAKQRQEKTGRVQGCDANGVPLDPNHHWAT